MHTNNARLIKERGKHPMAIHPPVIFSTFIATDSIYGSIATTSNVRMMTHGCWGASTQIPTHGLFGSDMNITGIAPATPAHVAGLVITVLLFVTLMTLPRNMAAAGPTHRKHHIAFLIGSSVLMSFFLVIIMIDITALI